MIGGFVLDPSALLDAATGRTVHTRALVRTSVAIGVVLVLPATALAEVWSQLGPELRASLVVFVGRVVVVVEPLADVDAEPVGRLAGALGSDPGRGLGIAHAVHVARRRGWPVVTAVPELVRSLDPEVAVDELP